MPLTSYKLCYFRYEFDAAVDQEIQDTGFWANLEVESGIAPEPGYFLDTALDKLQSAWAEWTTSNFSTDITGRRIVGYYYGGQAEAVVARAERALTFNGSGGRLPLQCTVVLSEYGYDPSVYVADRANKRGRMYLPTPSDGVMGTDPYMTPTAQAQYLSDAQDWYQTAVESILVNVAEEEGNLRPGVVSKAKQTFEPWQFFRVGRIIDTQRRRRNALTENYVSGAVTA